MTPRNKEFLFKHTHAAELLRIAEADLESAEALIEIKRGRPETACFLAQQAVEKSVKAVLISLKIPVPLVHDVGILVAKLPQDITPPKGYDLSELTAFATSLRYREGESVLTEDQVAIVLTTAREVIAWSKQRIKNG